MTIAVNLNQFTLYSNQRTQGPFYGSFMQLTMSGFSSLYGCGAFYYNSPKPTWDNNALYCIVQNSNSLKIYSNIDTVISGYLYVTLNTGSLPSSTTYIFEVFDRYVSGTNYGRSVYTTGSFARSASGYTLLQPTSMKWRRQAYKELRTDAGPIRLTVNNNFQYVSNYNMGSNAEDNGSDGLLVYVPNGITSGSYYCITREYPPTKYHLYKQYDIPCSYYTTNQMLIKSIPSHIRNPAFMYEFIIYKNAGASTSLLTTVSSNPYIMQVGTINAYSSGTVQYYDYIPVYKYQNVYPIQLINIYILTKEASAVNSLYINFNVGIASTTVFFF